MRRFHITLIVSMVSLGGCTDDVETEAPVDGRAELATILTGPGDECQRSSECPSRVCKLGFCSTAIDASETWMEHVMGARIAELAKADPSLIDALIADFLPAVERDDSFVRGRVAGILGAVGDARVIPILVEWTQSDIERIAVRAWLALGRLGHEPAWDALLELMTHRSAGARLDAVDALGRMTRLNPTAEHVETLVALMDHADYRVRQRTIASLGGLPLSARTTSATQALQSVLDSDSDGYLQYDATRALAGGQ
ncbi:MAG: hypothetical protein ACI9OJ_000970 [Myxococcota bacterium]|jgi:hypothetical protein